MRWLLQRGNAPDDAPIVLSLADASDRAEADHGIAPIPGGGLSLGIHSAAEALDTLADLRRVQQDLFTAQARAAGAGLATIGSDVRRQFRRPASHLRRAGSAATRPVRRFRPARQVAHAGRAPSSVFDGLDAALLFAEAAGGIDDALRLVGAAIDVVGDVITEIDIGDITFD
ncbi:MAG: hypothetical protein ACRD1H_10390 [Vicinamibacterales bacterium]